MTPESSWRTLSGPFLLLILIYLVWFLRYPTWRLIGFVELLFVMLTSSYFVVLLLSLFFLKKDAKKNLTEFFKIRSYSMVLIGIAFAFLFQAVWFSISLGIGNTLEFQSFPRLKGYESYAVHSILLGFALYLTLAVFGAFVEEVAFRGYVQSRITSRHGYIVGILVASLFFSLEHIHIFEPNWVARFLQTQFIYVFCFGVFAGYLFLKSKEDVWSVFAFHAVMNIFNVSLPIEVTSASPLANQFAAIASFVLMILFLHFALVGRRSRFSQQDKP